MRYLIATLVLAALTLSVSADPLLVGASFRLTSSPANQVERVEATYRLASSPSHLIELLPRTGSGMVELKPTRIGTEPFGDLVVRLSPYPGKENPYVHPEGTRWPYPMSAPTYDGHYHLPGGQW